MIAFAGGGTGGHTASGLAVIEAARTEGPFEGLILGTDRPGERALTDRAGVRHVAIATGHGGRLGTFRKVARLPIEVIRARRTLAEAGVGALLGLGGYAMVPAVLAARTLGIPYALIEQNAIPGRANRLLAGGAHAIFAPFLDGMEALGPRAVLTGNPVRAGAVRPIERDVATDLLGLPADRPALLVQGGSQGARALNEAALRAIPRLATAGVSVCHLAGSEEERSRASDAYRRAGVPAFVAAFQGDVALTYRACDVVLARAGGTSIAEILAVGLPAVYVPYPLAADDHQAANARAATRGGAGRVFPEALIDDAFATAIDVACDPAAGTAMREAALRLARPDAARTVWRWMRGIAQGEGRRLPMVMERAA